MNKTVVCFINSSYSFRLLNFTYTVHCVQWTYIKKYPFRLLYFEFTHGTVDSISEPEEYYCKYNNHTVPKIIGMFAYKTESITVGANATVHISFAFYTCTVYQAQKPVLIRHSKWRLCTVRITAFQSSMFPLCKGVCTLYCTVYTVQCSCSVFFMT